MINKLKLWFFWNPNHRHDNLSSSSFIIIICVWCLPNTDLSLRNARSIKIKLKASISWLILARDVIARVLKVLSKIIRLSQHLLSCNKLLCILICCDWSPSRYVDSIGGKKEWESATSWFVNGKWLAIKKKKIDKHCTDCRWWLRFCEHSLGIASAEHVSPARAQPELTNVITHAIIQVQIFFWCTPDFILSCVDYGASELLG